jgi:hypothetical protein
MMFVKRITDCRVYIETTLFNRYVEEGRDYCSETRLMFGKITSGEIRPFTSAYVVEELDKSPAPKRERMMELIPRYEMIVLGKSDIAEVLADMYLEAGIIPKRNRLDAVHIALATIHAMDCIVSLNFRHINKITTKLAVEAMNRLNDYETPIICTPMEVF